MGPPDGDGGGPSRRPVPSAAGGSAGCRHTGAALGYVIRSVCSRGRAAASVPRPRPVAGRAGAPETAARA